MKISKQLIEKYHNGTCSAEEKDAVENWLLSDESDDWLAVGDDEFKTQLQAEMWKEISSVLPNDQKEPVLPNFKATFSPFLRRFAAAALLIIALGSALYVYKYSSGRSDIIVMNNASGTINKNIIEKEYTISVGPKSNVEINNQTGMIDFCGAVMINPNRDMEFTIQGTCSKRTDSSEKMILKKGLNYIALNYSSRSNVNEVIVVEEGSMMGLPPLVMKQLLHQFNI